MFDDISSSLISFVVLSHGPPEKDQQFQYVPSIRNVDALERSIIAKASFYLRSLFRLFIGDVQQLRDVNSR